MNSCIEGKNLNQRGKLFDQLRDKAMMEIRLSQKVQERWWASNVDCAYRKGVVALQPVFAQGSRICGEMVEKDGCLSLVLKWLYTGETTR